MPRVGFGVLGESNLPGDWRWRPSTGLSCLFLNLEKCVSDESCREKLAPISPTGPKFVAQANFFVHR